MNAKCPTESAERSIFRSRHLTFRWLLLLGVLLLLLAAAALLAIYLAVRHEPAFYRQALKTDHAVLEKGSHLMLQQAAKLASNLRQEKPWKALFTADEINGWLAVDMMKNHPGTLPPTMRDPRVIISSTQVTIACRFRQNGVESVLSLTVEPSVPEPNVLALRIVKARAGLLPVPLGQVLDQIKKAAGDMHLDLRWRHANGDPVAMLSLPANDDDQPVHVDTLELGDGEIYVAGNTGKP